VFDVLTIAAVADELADRLLDGRIQRIGLVDRRTIAAEVYAAGSRHFLLASADDRQAGIHLTSAMTSLDAELITPFGLLLRKYTRGGVIVGIEQPPMERTMRLTIAKRMHERGDRDGGAEDVPAEEEDADEAEGAIDATFVHLQVEVMGRHSNLVLVDDDGLIMESCKRVTPAMSRVRQVLPRLPYSPPPPIDRPDPRRVTANELASLIAAADSGRSLDRWLVTSLRGVSPQMGREIAFRTTGVADAALGGLDADGIARLARETRGLLEPLLTSAWSPQIYREDGEVVAYSAVPMQHLAVRLVEEPAGSISGAIEAASAIETIATPGKHAQRRARLLAMIEAALAKQRRKLANVREQGARAQEIDLLRLWGETIYANLWQITPGQAELDVDGIRVPLDPAIPAKEMAQRYFEEYRKAQSAGMHQEELEGTIATEVAYLEQLATLTEQAEGFADLEALLTEFEAHEGTPSQGRRRARQAPRKPVPMWVDDDGNAVFVGRSAAQNDAVTFAIAGPEDTWLHARGVGGSHVVIRWRNPQQPEREATVLAAAQLAAWFSAARTSARVEVDVAKRKHVRKIKGGPPGLVTYRNERTVAVAPTADSPRER